MIKKMTNKDSNFYKYMGEIFGSREIQRETSDRFYDDDGKEWFLYMELGVTLSVVSVKENVIKNVYSCEQNCLISILKQIYPDISSGIVPKIYENSYIDAGYTVSESNVNFVKIKGGLLNESEN